MAEKRQRTALVTGSTKGIGKAVAESLAEEGYHVIVNGRKEEDTQKLCEELKKAYPDCETTAAPGDAGTEEGLEAIIKAVDAVGDLDVLVNNVGIYGTVDFFEGTRDLWSKYFEVNIMSTVRLSQHYLKKMLDRNSGRIIVISSEAAFKPVPMMIHYSYTKAAQVNIARGMAELTRGTNVTVNCVLPGPTETEGVMDYFGGLAKDEGKTRDEVIKDYFKVHEPASILQRLVRPKEVANAVCYLASDKSSGTNGSSIRVEGGLYRSI